MTLNPKLNVFEYSSYRLLLHDWFWFSKKENPKVSFRFISRHLSLKAPNHFHLVITQKRHLSLPVLEKVMRLMKLSSMERQYVKVLFAEDLEKTPEKRQKLQERRKLLQVGATRESQDPADLKIVGHRLAWYIKMGAIVFEGKSRDQLFDLVKAAANFAVAKVDFDQAIEILLKTRQLEFVDGLSRFEGESILTKWDFDNAEIKQHHRENLGLAVESVSWPVDKRFLSSITIPCNDEIYKSIISEIRSLCLQLLENSKHKIVSNADVTSIATLQFALFPFFDLTRSTNAS